MSQPIDIAVIGATGTVGETLVQILEEQDFPVGTLHLLASNESAGSGVMFRSKSLRVREVDSFDFSKVKLVFFAAGPAVTRSFAPRAQAAGCTVIDLSGGLPAEQAPALVPEANAARLDNLPTPLQVSSPSAAAVALAVALAPLKVYSTLNGSTSPRVWRSRPKVAKLSMSWPGKRPSCSMLVRWSHAFSTGRWRSTCWLKWAPMMQKATVRSSVVWSASCARFWTCLP